MNTFRAILLPCAGTAGGVPVHPHAAGRHIIVACGNLSARRPGEATRNQPLPAERLRLGVFSNYQPLTRVSRSAAQTAGRREVATDRIRVRRGPAFGGIWKNVRSFRLLNPARINFSRPFKASGSLSGPHSALTVCQDTLRNRAKSFQVNHSFRNAPEFHEQRDRSDVECPTKALKRLTR